MSQDERTKMNQQKQTPGELDSKSEKYPLRTQRKVATRLRIVSSALHLAGIHGAANVTMAMVADSADVHVTTLFTHFTSKAELFSGISEPAIDALTKRIAEAQGTVPFFAFVKTIQEEFATVMVKKGQEVVDHSLFLRTQVELLPAWIDYEKSQVSLMAEYLRHDYEISELEAMLFAGMIVSANIHCFDLWLSNPEANNLEQLARRNINEIEEIFHRARA
ncbi:MAG: AcrR family transcriptional regulator [Candidatus Azotimanducaceae bacterium]|jgi:AcrR family transcriptional regulator